MKGGISQLGWPEIPLRSGRPSIQFQVVCSAAKLSFAPNKAHSWLCTPVLSVNGFWKSGAKRRFVFESGGAEARRVGDETLVRAGVQEKSEADQRGSDQRRL